MRDTLLLNADGNPLSVAPLSTLTWQESIKLVWLDRINVLEWHQDWQVHSPNITMTVPSVIMTREFVKQRVNTSFNRSNVYLRDNYICQYCKHMFSYKDLTLDHVIPKSKGGKTKWENVVAACSKCNLKKSDLLLSEVNMKLIKQPFTPSNQQLQVSGKKFPPNYLHKSWMDYLYWDSELEKN